jgi:hypothetical protein
LLLLCSSLSLAPPSRSLPFLPPASVLQLCSLVLCAVRFEKCMCTVRPYGSGRPLSLSRGRARCRPAASVTLPARLLYSHYTHLAD